MNTSSTRVKLPTISDLEDMTTHQVADLLAQVVLLLRRLPDVPMRKLEAVPDDTENREAH